MALANRGVFAEKKVQDYLTWWMAASPWREFNRMVDSKSAGRIIKSAAADFEYFTDCNEDHAHGLIEVKQTEHDYRLARDKVSQLPRLRKREKCGGESYVVIYHSTLKKWRAVGVKYLTDTGDKGSWNLTNLPLFDTCDAALGNLEPGRFPPHVKGG